MPHQGVMPNEFGFFSPDGREFIITDPRTPTPWVNILSNGRYSAIVSQAGGGFSWLDNCQLHRITRWEQDLVADAYGRYIYLQDLDQPGPPWSTTWGPTRLRADIEAVTHGLGYTIFERELFGIRSRQTCFVPLEANCELWLLEVTNIGAETRSLRVASYVDWFLGAVGEWHREFHRLFIETSCASDRCLAWKHPGMKENIREPEDCELFAFHAVKGAESVAWNTSKASFIGPGGSLANPDSLRRQDPSCAGTRWQDPIASVIVPLSLGPGETKTLLFVLGAETDRAAAEQASEGWTICQAQRELDRLKDHWSRLLQETFIETPDEGVNLLTNHWMKYQTIVGRLQARCGYYQQGGAYGYRDQLQDSLLWCSLHPEKTKQQLRTHLEAMYEDGGVRHWWHPGTEIFSESRHSDTSLWPAYGFLAYLDESNDLDFAEEPCRFLSRTTQRFGAKGTVLDHVLRGIDRALERRSARGLPLIGAGDWNDGLSHAGIDGKGESVWLAMFLVDILRRLTPTLKELGRCDLVAGYDLANEELFTAINKHGWDGDWYVAGFRDDGRPFGSHECKEGSIFLNPQTWAAISGSGTPERVRTAMESVRERLVKPYGALLLAPAFDSVDPSLGYITRYAPGLRENGGVYSHASTWAIQAFAMMGEMETAYSIYRSMSPPCRAAEDAGRYAAEPYVMPGNVDGPDSPNEGRAGWTWYTGSSAWMYRIALDWLCGVRATRKGLLIEPGAWETYRVMRRFRGERFDIRFNITGLEKALQLHVDGEPLDGNLLTSAGSGAIHSVSATSCEARNQP